MSIERFGKFLVGGLASVALVFAAGCSSMSNTLSATSSAQTGQAFVIGTDAPAAAVVSFTAQIKSVIAADSSGNGVSLVSGEPVVDFARYNGLQTLLDIGSVPVGTYTSISITLEGTPTIGYLDMSTTPPSIKTISPPLTNTTVTVQLTNPLVITKTVSMGLRVDFDLHKSIQITNGEISGVNPTFDIRVVKPGDADGHVDEFVGGVVSVDSTNQQFVIQGPHGRQLTVKVDGQTQWDGNATLQDLNSNTIVQISGHIDNADSTIDADEVTILSQDKFFASGQVTCVTPASGAASSFDLYLRSLEPTGTGLTLGEIATVALNGNENYYISWMRNPMTEFLFNSSALVAGQDVAIGGPVSGAANPAAVTTKRVVLRQWGFEGTIVPGSLNASAGTFQMQVNGFAGVLIPTPVTVYIGAATDFRDGFTSVSDVPTSTRVRVVGLLLKNPTTGQIVLLARFVDDRAA